MHWRHITRVLRKEKPKQISNSSAGITGIDKEENTTETQVSMEYLNVADNDNDVSGSFDKVR